MVLVVLFVPFCRCFDTHGIYPYKMFHDYSVIIIIIYFFVHWVCVAFVLTLIYNNKYVHLDRFRYWHKRVQKKKKRREIMNRKKDATFQLNFGTKCARYTAFDIFIYWFYFHSIFIISSPTDILICYNIVCAHYTSVYIRL